MKHLFGPKSKQIIENKINITEIIGTENKIIIAEILISILHYIFRFFIWNFRTRSWLIEWAYGPQRHRMWELD
jgi:hypothetical protein